MAFVNQEDLDNANETYQRTGGPNPSTVIAEYSTTEAALQELRQRYKDVKFDVTTTAGMTEAKKVRNELVTYRTDLERRRKEVKAPAWERCQLIDAEAKRITAELEALEKPIAKQIDEENASIAAERQAKIDAENLRRTTIQTKIQKFRQVAGAMVNKTSAEIEETIYKVLAAVVDESTYNEFLQDAEEARDYAVDSLRELLLKVQEAEAEQARIAAERVELEELRAKQAEMQKQIDEQNRIQNERLAAEQRKLEQDREVQERELLKEKQVADAIVAKQQQEAAEKAREQEAIDQAQRAEKQRLERERLALEQQQLAEAERTKKLLAAKKDTPVAALSAILEICRTFNSAEMALAHIAIIAEANIVVPNIIEVAKPKRAAKK